ncbi:MULTISPECIES: hypothetical protein [Streptomyces]|uniref:hypothetical protein n=1 Tax=Streptomyces TaxID=1883 RepID=UPI00287FEEF2|nr:hypothetical protein [Streptomyces sp. CGMCC 4.1456]WNF62041.1 hypothetical protein RJD14_05320 [Streptomyces sp. CGMCC 4.1456]
MLPDWTAWHDDWSAPGATASAIFRGLLALVVLLAAFEPVKELNPQLSWREGTFGFRFGRRIVTPGARAVLASVLVVGAALFTADLFTVAALVVITAVFTVLAVVYLSQEFAGYVTEEDDGTKKFKVHHHLHLLGMALLSAAACGVVALLEGHAMEPRIVTLRIAQGMWGAIAAHYFVSAVSKVRKRGLRWPDRRLFPFYITLFARYRAGDGKSVEEKGLPWFLVRNPNWGVLLLWIALLMEFSTPLILLGSGPRLVLCACLVLFHLSTLWLLAVDFRENAMIAAVALLPVPYLADSLTSLSLAPLPWAVFAVCVVLSLAFDDRIYPFSNLPMFAAAYRPISVVTLRSADGSVRYDTPKYAHCPTTGLSREYAAAESEGQGLGEFLERVRERTAHQNPPLPADAFLWAEVVDVTPTGRVVTSEAPLTRVQPEARAH